MIALPILLVVIFGAIQFGLIYQAKATLNHAALQAARSGAVHSADGNAIRRGLARGLLPLYSPDSSMDGVAATLARIETEIATTARVRILNPTREAFEDFGEDVEGVRKIPNDRLHTRSTTVGTQSGLNIQDANLLRVEITYGYELKVPLVNWFITRTLLAMRGSRAADAFHRQLLSRTLLPIVATATVRMQSPARLNALVVSRADLPDVERIDSAIAPPPIEEDEQDEARDDEDSSSSEELGSSLADGFFGFGQGGPVDSSESGPAPGGGSAPSDGAGGENSGNPQMCAIEDTGGSPFGDASQETSQSPSLPSLGVGNPIHVVTGNKYQKEVDVAPLPGGLSFIRHYNSELSSTYGALGAGWRHSYEASLRRNEERHEIVITQPDGRTIRFRTDGNDRRYSAQRASDGEIELREDEMIWRLDARRAMHFDAGGRLYVFRSGPRETRLHYDERDRLDRVEDSHGAQLRFAYYRNGRLARVVTPTGAWRYRYDERGNLSAVVSPDESERRYEYGDPRHPHHLTSIEVQDLRLPAFGSAPEAIPLGSWTYDDRGRGVSSTHPLDADKVTLSYGEGYTDVTDAFGRTSRYVTAARSGVAIVTEVRGPGCGACGPGDVRYQYTDRLQVAAVISRSGISTRNRYDSLGRLVETARSVQGGAPEWQVRYIYEGRDLQPARVERPSVNPAGVLAIAFVRDSAGQILRATESGFSPSSDGSFAPIERTYRFEYDGEHRLIAIDGPRTGVSDVTRFEYDIGGRLIAIRSADGTERRVMAHDAMGRPARIQLSGAPDVTIEYDAVGRIAALVEHTSAGTHARRFAYDSAGRIRSRTDVDGTVHELDRDAAGRIKLHARSDTTFARANMFEADGRIAKTAHLSRSGSIASLLHFVYDDQRRLIELRDGSGPPLRQLIYTDDDSHPDQMIDALGHTTHFDYDALGRLIRITAPDSGVSSFEYTARNALKSMTAPNGAHTRYEYDDFGRRVREHSSDRGTTQYKYDAADNVIEKIDARGIVSTLTYSATNRLESLTTPDGTTHFSYTSDRLTKVSGPWGEEVFKYDANGRLVRHEREIAGRRFSTRTRYDNSGRVVGRRMPSGTWLTNSYDANGALTRISLDRMLRDPVLVERSSEHGTPVRALGDLEFGNALAQRARFDASGRIRARSIQNVAHLRYEYDEGNRLVRLVDQDRQTTYGYDAVNRLEITSNGRGTVAYSYDKNGNRLSTVRRDTAGARPTASRTEHTYAPSSNRLLHSTNGSRENVRYDASGNPIEIGQFRYEYDGSGRLIRLYIGNRLASESTYNVWGERIRKTVYTPAGKQTTLYLYRDHRLIAEADEDGTITREYFYLEHHPIAMLDRGELLWIHTNHLGAPIAATDDARRIVWRAEYEPFGQATVNEDPDDDGKRVTLNLRFPGQYADAESGTYYNVARDYDPALGRYLTSDPLGVAAGANTYAYVHNMPTSRFDSLGLYDVMVHYYVTYFLGIVAGLPQDVARTIAIATQYVDENSLTWPYSFSALPLYHFVMTEQGPLHGDATTDLLRRFYNPNSPQLDNLFASTNISTLLRLWQEAHPDLNACPTPWTINNARYQLFGEYLHAYEDTFAHRDLLNMPYGIAPNDDNTPPAFFWGHMGLGTWNPAEFEPPDLTYNQDYRDTPSECWIGNSVRSRRVIRNISEHRCRNQWGGEYIPPQTNEWQLNELRTLRMQYEVFRMIGENFSEEIAANRQLYAENNIPLPTISWQDLAGRAWNEQNAEANARIGLSQTYDQWRASQGLSELSTVLQRFNASDADAYDRLAILNAWLKAKGFVDSNGDAIQIERWASVEHEGAERRWRNIGWIPANSFASVLLPRDELCYQTDYLPGDCTDRPRR